MDGVVPAFADNKRYDQRSDYTRGEYAHREPEMSARNDNYAPTRPQPQPQPAMVTPEADVPFWQNRMFLYAAGAALVIMLIIAIYWYMTSDSSKSAAAAPKPPAAKQPPPKKPPTRDEQNNVDETPQQLAPTPAQNQPQQQNLQQQSQPQQNQQLQQNQQSQPSAPMPAAAGVDIADKTTDDEEIERYL